MTRGRIPIAWKVGWAIWLAVWIPLHAAAYGFSSFLWVCAIANVLVGVALWLEDSLLLSMQALSVLLLQAIYSLDLAVRALTGRHVIGGTEYVFAASAPLGIRLLSLFHVFLPVVILVSLGRLGYDARALKVQIAAGWVVLAASVACGREANVNGVWFAPGGLSSPAVSWSVYFALLCAALPLFVYLPTHLVLSRTMAAKR